MRFRAALTALIAAGLAAAPGAHAGHAAAREIDQFTPLVQNVVATPAPVKGSDGRFHVVYEVQVTNATGIPWNVTRVTVRGATGSQRRLATWSGKRVDDVLQSLGGAQPIRRLDPGQSAVLFLTFSTKTRARVPASLVQELALNNAKPSGGGPPSITEVGGRTRVAKRAPTKLGPPLEGPRWVAADGCCTARRHVRAAQPIDGQLYNAQRFAIDWERLDENRRLWVGDEKVLENWAGYGENILAVADATVVRAIDGLPDQVPGKLPTNITILEADGNAVFLRLDNGRFVFNAHMIPGSVRVKRGDRVRKGQVIGRVGNSGNSSAPHLHQHVMDRNAILGANGLPYVFDAFTITGKIASTQAFNDAELNGTPAKLGRVKSGARRGKLTLDQVIVTWP